MRRMWHEKSQLYVSAAERARHSLAAAGEVHGNSQPELEKRIAAYNEAKGIIRNTLKASEGEQHL